MLGPFYIGVRRVGGGFVTVSLYKPAKRPDAKYSAKCEQWARTRDWALVGLRVEANKMRALP